MTPSAVYRDPFQTTTILQYEKFIDRREMLDKLLGKILTGGHTSIIGNRRVGKSSLLRYLSFPETRLAFSPDYRLNEYIILYLDPQDTVINRQDEFAEFVFKESNNWLTKNGFGSVLKLINKELPPKLQNINEFLFRLRRETKLGMILLIDEFEYFSKGAMLGEAFFKKLRALGDQQYILFITASGKTLEQLTRESRIAGSEFWNIFTNDFIGLFSEEDVLALIKSYIQKTDDVQFTEDDIKFILDKVGLHPYFVQRACGKLYSHKFHHYNKSDYGLIYDELLAEEWQRLGAYFYNLSDLQKATVLSFLKDDTALDNYFDGAIPNLFQNSIVYKNSSGKFQFFSSLFREYLLRNVTSSIQNNDRHLISPTGKISDGEDTSINFLDQMKSAALHQLEIRYSEALSEWRDKQNEYKRYLDRLISAEMKDVVITLNHQYGEILEKEQEELQAVYSLLIKIINSSRDGRQIDNVLTLLANKWPKIEDIK